MVWAMTRFFLKRWFSGIYVTKVSYDALFTLTLKFSDINVELSENNNAAQCSTMN